MRGAPLPIGPDIPLSTPPWPASTTIVYCLLPGVFTPRLAAAVERYVGGPVRAPSPRMVGRTVVPPGSGSPATGDSVPLCGGRLSGCADSADAGGDASDADATRIGACRSLVDASQRISGSTLGRTSRANCVGTMSEPALSLGA